MPIPVGKKYAKEDVHSFVPHGWVSSKVCKQFYLLNNFHAEVAKFFEKTMVVSLENTIVSKAKSVLRCLNACKMVFVIH